MNQDKFPAHLMVYACLGCKKTEFHIQYFNPLGVLVSDKKHQIIPCHTIFSPGGYCITCEQCGNIVKFYPTKNN